MKNLEEYRRKVTKTSSSSIFAKVAVACTRLISILRPKFISILVSFMILVVADSMSAVSKAPHWSGGLAFGCTGCGRCCQNEGEVWLNREEVAQVVEELHLPSTLVLETYIDEITNGWVRLKNSFLPATGGETEQCIFLGRDGKTCSIYNSRPVQCRTYPYWPRLMTDKVEWDNEKVVPETENGKHWTAADGGCEGIEHKDAPRVHARHIYFNSELYNAYQAGFNSLSLEHDRENLLNYLDISKRVKYCTTLWVKEFLINYHLRPLPLLNADILARRSARYVPTLLTTEKEFAEKLKFEILYLLAHKEEVVSSTLLVLPFFKPNFEEFSRFQVFVQSTLLPTILKDMDNDITALTNTPAPTQTDNPCNEIPRNDDTQSNSPEVQMSFYHPHYLREDFKDNPRNALHFEKRAPFPTITIFRSAILQKPIHEKQIQEKIEELEPSFLEVIGFEALTIQFQSILQSALS